MFTVQFSPCRVVEYTDPAVFERRVNKWLMLREAEHSFLLGNMHDITRCFQRAGSKPRLFTLEDEGAVMGVAVVLPDGLLILTWLTQPMQKVLVEGLFRAGCKVSVVYGPAHVSWRFARDWCALTGQQWSMGPEERGYQLGRLLVPKGIPGHLEMARAEQREMLVGWMEAFIHDTGYVDSRTGHLVDTLIAQRRAFLWVDEKPVAMAAWVMPTAHGACVNFVYTVPEARGRGYGKAVVAGVAEKMFEAGLEYCFIYTGTTDRQSNSLYQAIGARTICEFMRCTLSSPQKRGAESRPEVSAEVLAAH